MKILNVFFLLTLITLVSCTKEEEIIHICDTPVQIEDFRINLETIEDLNDFENLVLLTNRSEKLRFDFTLRDENQVGHMEFYFLINNDPDLKYYLFRPFDQAAAELGYARTFDKLEKFYLENEEEYITEIGDRLHFYLKVEDNTIHSTEIKFVIELN